MEIIDLGIYDLTDMTPRPGTWGTLLERQKFIKNPDTPITQDVLYISRNNMNLLFFRNENITQPRTYVKDGTFYYETPITKREKNRNKDGSRFIVTKNVLPLGFYYQTDKILEALDYTEHNKPEGNLYYYYDKIITNILHNPKTALYNVLNSYGTNNKVEIVNNDVVVNKKKVYGGDEFYNNTGVFHQVGMTWLYEDEVFMKYLPYDEYWRETKEGITGIKNEFPTLELEQFKKDYTDEVLRLIQEVEDISKEVI